MKKWKRYLPIGMLALLIAAAAMLTTTVKAQTSENDTIPDQVYFGSISGGGLTKEEASEKIQQYVEQLGGTKVTLQAGKNTVEATAADLGLTWGNPDIVEEAAGLGKSGNLIERYKAMKDLEHEEKVYRIGYAVDAAKVKALLEQKAAELNTEAVDAGLTRNGSGFQIIPGSQGVTLNIEESLKEVESFFAKWDEKEAAVTLAADVVDPKGTEEELSKVKDVLGAFHTDYSSSSSNRAKNVANGANRINGSVIYPGDQYSVYEAVSPFDAENGYELAGSYENGTTVESYGGGICQVSTTLYNAVIRAELDIVERFAHSMIVGYVDPSADAAIAGTYKDLKFVNNTDAPIYIEGYTSGMQIYFTIYGHETRAANREISFVSETTSSTDPGVEFKASGAPIGSISRVQGSHQGKTARLWKVVKVDGVEQSREEFNKSSYQASPTIYEVGTASANPEAVANINAAIATQDEGAIRAAAAAWNDEATAAAAAAAEAEAAAAAAAAQQQQEQQQLQQQEEDKKKDESKDGDKENGENDGKDDNSSGENKESNDNKDGNEGEPGDGGSE